MGKLLHTQHWVGCKEYSGDGNQHHPDFTGHTSNHGLRPEITRIRLGAVLVHPVGHGRALLTRRECTRSQLAGAFPEDRQAHAKVLRSACGWAPPFILPWHRPRGRCHHTYFTEVSPERLRLRVSKLLRDKAIHVTIPS